MRDNYKTISAKLAERKDFRGNSMWASWLSSSQYMVFSYATPIAEIDLLTGKTWISSNKYSVTTSRHQNLIRRAWGLTNAN